MASLHEITVGQDIEFKRVLAKAGFGAETILHILKNPGLAERMLSALQESRVIFTPPEEQISLVRKWSDERGWGLTEQDFEKLGPAPAVPEERLVAVTLVPYRPDLKKIGGMLGYLHTFQELWAVAASRQEKSWRWDGYDHADSSCLKLLDGIMHTPGLRWEIINLGANRGKAPKDVRNPKSSPHAGILAAAALHPELVRSMDGDRVPYVWAPGYQVTVPGNDPWQDVPCLLFGRGGRWVDLLCLWDGLRSDDWAVPAVCPGVN